MRLCGEQAAVGGEGEVVEAVDRHQARDQVGQSATQQRLTAGDAQLAHARAHEPAHEALDLVERQPRRGIEAVVFRHAIGRHAVRAAEIAGLDHRQAQVAQRAPEGVARRGGGLRDGIHRREGTRFTPDWSASNRGGITGIGCVERLRPRGRRFGQRQGLARIGDAVTARLQRLAFAGTDVVVQHAARQ